jgi:hypothetical protein
MKAAIPPRWIVWMPLLLACGPESAETPAGPRTVIATHRTDSDQRPWSEPVWLGPIVNSSGSELRPAMPANELTLYFGSDRAGGRGGIDIWASRRAGRGCPWQAPVNLGPPINTAGADGGPAFVPDGHLLYFASDGHGGFGSSDIFVSHRDDPANDFGWSDPVNLGPGVNTSGHESGPSYARGELYFTRDGQIYVVQVSHDGQTRGPAVHLSELSDPVAPNRSATVWANGKELIFWGQAGTRTGSVGLADLWVATRQSATDRWSAPRNLGRPVNSEFAELEPGFSHNGRTLLFSAGQARGGVGLQDIWMSTRDGNAESDGASACPE